MWTQHLLIFGVSCLLANLHLYTSPATKKSQLLDGLSLSQIRALKASCPCSQWIWGIRWVSWSVAGQELLELPCIIIVLSPWTSHQLCQAQHKREVHSRCDNTCCHQLSMALTHHHFALHCRKGSSELLQGQKKAQSIGYHLFHSSARDNEKAIWELNQSHFQKRNRRTFTCQLIVAKIELRSHRRQKSFDPKSRASSE